MLLLNYEIPIKNPKFTAKEDYVRIIEQGNKELRARKMAIIAFRKIIEDLQEQLFPTR